MAKDKTNVLIVDDHSVVTEEIKGIVGKEQDLEIAGSATDGLKALAMLKSLKPGIVILDILMANLDGVETTRRIKE